MDEIVRVDFISLPLLRINRLKLCSIICGSSFLALSFAFLISVLVYQDLKKVRQDLHSFLDFSLDEIEDTFCEVLVHGQSFRGEVVISSALQAVIGLIVVFLPQA